MAKNGKLIWVLHYNSKNPQSNHFCHLWAKNYQLASDLQSFERKKIYGLGYKFLEKCYCWFPSALPHIELWPPSSCYANSWKNANIWTFKLVWPQVSFRQENCLGKKNDNWNPPCLQTYINLKKLLLILSGVRLWYLYNWDLMKLGEKVPSNSPFSS